MTENITQKKEVPGNIIVDSLVTWFQTHDKSVFHSQRDGFHTTLKPLYLE